MKNLFPLRLKEFLNFEQFEEDRMTGKFVPSMHIFLFSAFSKVVLGQNAPLLVLQNRMWFYRCFSSYFKQTNPFISPTFNLQQSIKAMGYRRGTAFSCGLIMTTREQGSTSSFRSSPLPRPYYLAATNSLSWWIGQ